MDPTIVEPIIRKSSFISTFTLSRLLAMAQLQLASVGCYFRHVAAGFHLAIMMHTHLFYISSDGIVDA